MEFMRKDKVPEGRKEAESKFLLERFKETQSKDKSLTQDSLAAKLNVSQGLIGQWLSGKTNVPDERLIKISLILNFAPYKLRPSLKDKGLLAGYSDTDKAIVAAIPSMSDDLKRLILSAIRTDK